jgi:SAM-dependent methyltransferase
MSPPIFSGSRSSLDSDGINWEWERHSSDNAFYESLTRALRRNTRRGAVVLEVGVGSGHGLTDLNRGLDCRCYGVDIQPSAVAAAKNKARGFAASLHLAVGSGFALPFPDDAFDSVMSLGVIEHFPPDRSRALVKEHARVCRPGGRVLISAPNALDLFHTIHRWSLGRRYAYWPERSYSPFSLARELKAVGLVPVAVDGYGPFWTLRQSRLLYPLGAALSKLGLLDRLAAISDPRVLSWCGNMVLQVGEKPQGA